MYRAAIGAPLPGARAKPKVQILPKFESISSSDYLIIDLC